MALDSAGLKSDFTAKSVRLRKQKDLYVDFSISANLKTRNERHQVYGFNKTVGSKSSWENRKNIAKNKDIVDKTLNKGYNIGVNLQLFANKDLIKQTNKQLEKGIKSYKKQIQTHNDKINNPQKYVEKWNKMSKMNQDGLIKHWNKEINVFNKNISDNIEELKKRGVNIDKK